KTRCFPLNLRALSVPMRGHTSRTLFLLAFSLAVACTVPHAEISTNSARIQLLSKEIFIRHRDGRPPASGFVSYISSTRPILMHCFGWEDYSDGYDDYSIAISEDNGKTWSEPRIKWRSNAVPEGKLRFAEPAAFFDSDKQRLVVLID